VAYRPLGPWNHEFTNHIYYCLTNYNDPEIIRQRVTSCLHHVIDEHQFDDVSLNFPKKLSV
jgi:hypothetical protein